MVAEFSPYEADLDWSALTEPEPMAVLEQLGRATAKVHCVSDVDDATTPLVEFQVDDAIGEVTRGRTEDFVADVTTFAMEYAGRVRADHAAFVDAFRNGRIEGVSPSAAKSPTQSRRNGA